jgi:hypothetical protein
MHFTVAPDLQFVEKALVKATKRKRGLANSMDIQWNDIPSDHNGIFCWMLTKNGTRTWYYYATTSGNGPNMKTNLQQEICEGKDLLSKKVTGSNGLEATIKIQTIINNRVTNKNRKITDIGGLLGRGSRSLEQSRLPSLPLWVCDSGSTVHQFLLILLCHL